ncbi:amidase family protein [Streptomyces milbemycinicus]|uniref:amidase family protein n=1 Tax=Streptomyces milbemycinicus TaxID=476552 RepID=UPI0033FAD4AF
MASEASQLPCRFRRVGLATFGRTATPEMAWSSTTECCTARPATRGPAAQSGRVHGGAGAAVVAGVVPIADATAAGSIRVPVAYNGLFGLKPTRGRVCAGPDFDEVFNGPAVQLGVSRTVRDSAALPDRMRGREPG